MRTLQTFLAGAFLGAASLGAAMPVVGLRAEFVAGAFTIGDVVEVVGAILTGSVATYLVNRRRRTAAAH